MLLNPRNIDLLLLKGTRILTVNLKGRNMNSRGNKRKLIDCSMKNIYDYFWVKQRIIHSERIPKDCNEGLS